MRLALLSILAAAGLTTAAMATAAQAAQIGPVSRINIVVGHELAAKKNVFSQRDLDGLASDLRGSLESHLGRAHAFGSGGGVLDVVIEDASPNRPTMTQLGARPGLDHQRSVSIGGAKVSGVYTAPDGSKTPVQYSFYDHDIHEAAMSASDWSAADRSFDLFANSLVR